MRGVSREERFLENSNLIEGIEYGIGEYWKWNKSKLPEINGHAKAFDYMKKHCSKTLTEKHILQMHKLLTKGLVDKVDNGKYRDIPVYIGGRQGMVPIGIKPNMKRLVKQIKNVKTEQDCWDIHDAFEWIHPFIDGNGRTGRLILNWLRFNIGLPLLIIYEEDKYKYYRKIEDKKFLLDLETFARKK